MSEQKLSSRQVTVGTAGVLDTPFDASTPAGSITGYVVSLGTVRWIGPLQQVAEVELLLSRAAV